MRSFHALALLRCVAVRGDRNHCNHHEVVADVDGTRAVHKTFKVLHGRGPVMASKSGACRRNKYSGLLPAQAYAIEVSVLTRLNERPRNASGACRGRYFPRLLRRDDAGLSFLQSHEGERIVTAWWHGRNPRPRVNRRFCALPRGEIACFATCATAALKAARVAHLDSFDVPTAAKNTVLRDGKLTLIVESSTSTSPSSMVSPGRRSSRKCAARTGWRRPTPSSSWRPRRGFATPPITDGMALRSDRRPPSAPRPPGTRAPPRPLTEARPAPPPLRPTSPPPPPPFSFCWDGSRVDEPAAVQPPAASAPRNGSSYNS